MVLLLWWMTNCVSLGYSFFEFEWPANLLLLTFTTSLYLQGFHFEGKFPSMSPSLRRGELSINSIYYTGFWKALSSLFNPFSLAVRTAWHWQPVRTCKKKWKSCTLIGIAMRIYDLCLHTRTCSLGYILHHAVKLDLWGLTAFADSNAQAIVSSSNCC